MYNTMIEKLHHGHQDAVRPAAGVNPTEMNALTEWQRSARLQGGVSADGKVHDLSADLPDDQQPGILRKRLDAGIAGDGVPAPENAGNGVQFEHPKREVTTRARGLGAQSRQTARDGAVGSFCFCAVTDGIAIPSTHIEHMGKDTAAHPAMGSPGCVRQSAKAGETGGGEQYGSQNRPQTGERTSC